ncbi:MAG: hypothetical protein JSV96_10485 [Candidatus Aminicenantes bacterium]|nr:MAG: hypothetical protein JSV96_10485 [Candidatus Aminicenantes bacterium]
MKKSSITFLISLFLFTFAAFSKQEKKVSSSLFEQPLLITSAGQSAEVQLASVLAKRAGLESTLSKLAGPADLENIKTLVLVLGVSMKGLGAAGLDLDKEKERITTMIKEAEKKKIPILFLHLGGEARRGQLSDELITSFLSYGRMVIVVKSGNKDKLFNQICKENNIPLIEVERTVEALAPFKEAFK